MLEEDLARLRSMIAHGASVHDIDEALEPLASASNPKMIVPLLLMLNDETDDVAMWSLVHAVEQFDDATYVRHFLNAISGMAVGSSRWVSIVMTRILNSDTSRAELIRQTKEAPAETRKAITFICEGINGRDIRFLANTTGVIVAASIGS